MRAHKPKPKPEPEAPAPVSESKKAVLESALARLSGLKSEGAKLMATLGHQVSYWRDEPLWAEGWCDKCRGKVAVACFPPPGASSIQTDSKARVKCAK